MSLHTNKTLIISFKKRNLFCRISVGAYSLVSAQWAHEGKELTANCRTFFISFLILALLSLTSSITILTTFPIFITITETIRISRCANIVPPIKAHVTIYFTLVFFIFFIPKKSLTLRANNLK